MKIEIDVPVKVGDIAYIMLANAVTTCKIVRYHAVIKARSNDPRLAEVIETSVDVEVQVERNIVKKLSMQINRVFATKQALVASL